MSLLVKIVRPLFWFSKPLGVLPLSFKNEKFFISKLSQVYTVCGTLCFLLSGYQKYVDMWSTTRAYTGQDILSILSNVIVNVFAALNIFYSMVCAKKLVQILNDVDLLLKTVKDPATEVVAAQVRAIVLVLQVAVFCNYMVFSWYDSSVKGFRYYETFKSTLRILSLTSISCIGTQFCALCLILRTLVCSLNTELLTWLNRTLKNPERDPKKLSRRLLELRMVFGKVYDVCFEMNNIFGIFILLTLTYHNTFIHMEVFSICAFFIESTLSDSSWQVDHTKAAIWAIVNTLKILAFFICSSLVYAETKKTGEIVCKYLTKLPPGRLLESIDCFSRAVAAMKPSFSANGFFTIDWEILFSSASACTVNTLILIQSYVNNNFADKSSTLNAE